MSRGSSGGVSTTNAGRRSSGGGWSSGVDVLVITHTYHDTSLTKHSLLRTSENSPSETVRKGVRTILQSWIWPVCGGRNGSKGSSLAARRPALQADPRLFGQFRRRILG